MKVTRRQLKKLIYEITVRQTQTLKLRVLDFDDTIAHTGEKVKLYTPDGYRMLSSDEYAVYEPQQGEYYDESSFDEFSRVDAEKAVPVPAVFKILGNFVSAEEGARIILILTARKQEVEQDVRIFLRNNGLDDTNIDFVGVGSSDPLEKVEIIDQYVKNYDIDFVSFFDDSIKNVTAVKEYLTLTGMRNDVAHIKSMQGKIKLIRKCAKEEK
jgi:hypothetical protein